MQHTGTLPTPRPNVAQPFSACRGQAMAELLRPFVPLADAQMGTPRKAQQPLSATNTEASTPFTEDMDNLTMPWSPYETEEIDLQPVRPCPARARAPTRRAMLGDGQRDDPTRAPLPTHPLRHPRPGARTFLAVRPRSGKEPPAQELLLHGERAAQDILCLW
jgi:hypothetical protein